MPIIKPEQNTNNWTKHTGDMREKQGERRKGKYTSWYVSASPEGLV
jgi:hypothetical protein